MNGIDRITPIQTFLGVMFLLVIAFLFIVGVYSTAKLAVPTSKTATNATEIVEFDTNDSRHIWTRTITHEKHDWVVFSNGHGLSSQHSPNCSCQKKAERD